MDLSDDSSPMLLPLTLPVNATQTTCTGKRKRRMTKKDSAPRYSELMSEFGTLASDLTKRPELAKLWMGLVISTKKILSDSRADDVMGKVLSLASGVNDAMPTIQEGTLAPSDAAVMLGVDAASATANSSDMSNVLLTRGACVGRSDHIRKQATERSVKRSHYVRVVSVVNQVILPLAIVKHARATEHL